MKGPTDSVYLRVRELDRPRQHGWLGGGRLCVVERDSKERDECLFLARRPNYVDGGSKKKRMAVCVFSWDVRETKRHASCGEVCVFQEREGGVDLDNEMG